LNSVSHHDSQNNKTVLWWYNQFISGNLFTVLFSVRRPRNDKDVFAVWCPKCLDQQRKIAELKEREGFAIVHISLDTDPHEDEDKVRGHLGRHDFDWYFAVAPTELTNDLIDDFGFEIISAPSTPVVLICEDQSTRLLQSGRKSADVLLVEVNKGC